MEGGSGKAKIQSPSSLIVKDEEYIVTLVWNSRNYDYMIIDGIKYLNESTNGQSTFTVPVKNISQPLKVIANTIAMSVPHEIEYTLTFNLIE